jgi:prolyl-tRNA synthetase
MTHGDDKGVCTPPLLAPTEIVIVPIYRSDEERGRVLESTTRILSTLTEWERRDPGRLRVHLDARQGIKPGAKYYEWELRGVPVRMEIGPKDLDKNQAMLVRRDTGEKRPASLDSIGEDASDLLARIQLDMLATARDRQDKNSIRGEIDYDRFRQIMEGDGAFVYAGWCGDAACEARIKEETKATIRVLPDDEFRSAEAPTHCLRCDGNATAEAVWAKAY